MEEDNEGMGYLSTLPQRVVTIYIPMVLFLIILFLVILIHLILKIFWIKLILLFFLLI